MRIAQPLPLAGALLGVAALGFAIFAWRAELDPIDVPSRASFPPEAIRRGAELAALGDCAACHTSPGGAAYAGGRAVPTPFGPIHSTNITPDPDTGIGRWSQSAFRRAMRVGVDRKGRHLYPAFPYDHFTLISDQDDAALYAFLMTRTPARAQPPANHLPFPLNIRWVVAGWKLLYFRAGPYEADPAHDAQWNRGSYLANGVGHCGGCHTPHNALGSENRLERFAGGEAEGWRAYAINSSSQARERWDAPALHSYLRNGWHELHGDAYGPMAAVTRNLGSISDSDLEAIAGYLASVIGPVDKRSKRLETAPAGSQAHTLGAAIYESACANCHDGVRPLPYGGVRLTLSTAVTDDSAINLVNVVLNGLPPRAGESGPIMPGFAGTLTDGQLESLVAYIRAAFGGKPPWSGVESTVREARNREHD